MQKIISGILAGTMGISGIVVLVWAFEAMGQISHARGGQTEAAQADAGHAAESRFAVNAGHDWEAELAEAGSSGEFTDTLDFLDHDPAKTGVTHSGRSRRSLARLELTDEQQEKVKALRSDFTRDMIRLRAESKLARVELRELMDETSPDLEKVKELAAAVSRAQGSVFERGTVFRAEFKHVLTPEQQEKLRDSFRGRRDGRRDGDMGRRRGGRESRNRR